MTEQQARPVPNRAQAVAAAGVVVTALNSRDEGYLFTDVMRDAEVMARHLIAAPTSLAPTDPRPIGPEVLKEAGFVHATDNGVTWAAVDGDGRELLYTIEHVNDGTTVASTFRLIDEEGDGSSLPVPMTAGELALAMSVLKFERR